MSTAILALIVAALVVIATGPLLIPCLQRLKFGQTIRSDGPQRHLSKAGTPTMGGIIFLPALIIPILIWTNGTGALWLFLFSFCGFGLIGFWDDYIKVALHRSLGLTAKQKLLIQFAVMLVVLFVAVHALERGTDLYLPGFNLSIDLHGWYYVLMAVFLVGMVNAVNLTDGLDGLAAGVSFFVFLGFLMICLLAIKYPPIMQTSGMSALTYRDLCIAAASMAGVCLGFLFYNSNPARLFMGDTGSLAIGGAVVALAILTKMEILLIILGGVYLIEAISVMLQVFSFKVFGKRIFKMSPLHHHFEMSGWSEKKVVYTFWSASALLILCSMLLVSI